MNSPALRLLLQRVTKQLPRLLAESAGIKAHVRRLSVTAADVEHDLELELEIDGRKVPLVVDVKARLVPDVMERVHKRPDVRSRATPLLVVPRLGAAARARLRAAGINHADLGGTLFLRAPGIRIDIVGGSRVPRLLPRQQVNPFSKQASLVARALLAAPRSTVTVTALASQLSLTKSWVSQVLAELAAEGWVEITDQGMRLADSVGLLGAWRLAYTWSTNVMTGFTLPFAHDELLEQLPATFRDLRWALTLQSGATLVAPHVRYAGYVYLYIDPVDYDKAVERLDKYLHAEPTDQGGNLQVLRPYYGAATFYDARQYDDALRTVSPVQLFLDLAHFPVRGAEAATAVARGVLSAELGLTSADVQRLVKDLT